MKNEQISIMLAAIDDLGNVSIPNIDSALALVENREKLMNAHKKNIEALKKVVVFTTAEQAFSAAYEQADNKAQLVKENQQLANAIMEKNKARMAFEVELLEKPFKCDLKTIKKAHLQDKEGNLLEGIKLKHLAALAPLLK